MMQQQPPPKPAPQQQTPSRNTLQRKQKPSKTVMIMGFIVLGVMLVLCSVEYAPFIIGAAQGDVLAACFLLFILAVFLRYAAPYLLRDLRLDIAKYINDPDRKLAQAQKQKDEEDQRRHNQATSAASYAPDQIGGQAVLGGAHSGTLTWYSPPYTLLPDPELAKHGVIIGSSGTGKTVSLLRIAYLVASIYGYRVFYLDAKGDRDTAAAFLAMMAALGKAPRMFPREPLDGWRGDGNALLNRLIAIETFSEPYYKSVSKRVLALICNDPAGPPRSSQQFFSRFNDDLKKQAKLPEREILGVELRYRAFFGALGDKLDSGWSWEDCQAAYILLDGLSLREEAASLGKFLVEDFAHYATRRKQPGRDLLIVDEYSALSTGTDAANLIERLRSFGCAMILSSRSYAGLGEEQSAERILDAANFILLHRCADPIKLSRRAGKEATEKTTHTIAPGHPQQHGTIGLAMDEEDAIHPDEARRLETGEALLIAHGRYLRTRVAQLPQLAPAAVDQARQWIDQAPAPPQIQPGLPAPTIAQPPTTP